MTCSADDCDRSVYVAGLCLTHYTTPPGIQDRRVPKPKRVSRHGPCLIDGCETDRYRGGWCHLHYSRWKRLGDPLAPLRRSPNGEGQLSPKGYKIVRRGPRRAGEHIFVMEEMLGRRLLPGENVHHRNGVRDDNRPENLELWICGQPAGQRVEDAVEWATEILNRYRPGLVRSSLTSPAIPLLSTSDG